MLDLKAITDQELMVIQKAGIDADNFLRANDFYVNTLKPALKADKETAKNDALWKPGKITDPQVVNAFNAYNSGKADGLDGINTVCTRIIRDGERAGKELERRAAAAKAKEKSGTKI